MALDKNYSIQLSKDLSAVFDKASERDLLIKNFSYPQISEAYQKHLINWKEIQDAKALQQSKDKEDQKQLQEKKLKIKIELNLNKAKKEKDIQELKLMTNTIREKYPLQFKKTWFLQSVDIKNTEIGAIQFKALKVSNIVLFGLACLLLVFILITISSSGIITLIPLLCVIYFLYMLYGLIKYNLIYKGNKYFSLILSEKFLTLHSTKNGVDKFYWKDISNLEMSGTSKAIIFRLKNDNNEITLSFEKIFQMNVNRIFEIMKIYKNIYS